MKTTQVKQRICSTVNTRENDRFYIKNIGFKNSGLTLEFRFRAGIGRSGVMIVRFCLNMGSPLRRGSEL